MKKNELCRGLVKIGLDFRASFSQESDLSDCRDLGMPTLILRGDKSPRPATRVCDLLGEAVDGARLRSISGAGHMLPITHAAEVNREIADHLDRFLEERRAA